MRTLLSQEEAKTSLHISHLIKSNPHILKGTVTLFFLVHGEIARISMNYLSVAILIDSPPQEIEKLVYYFAGNSFLPLTSLRLGQNLFLLKKSPKRYYYLLV